MSAPVMDVLWSRRPTTKATVHALVIGVSRYDHLPGGGGVTSSHSLLSGLGQLSAAASSATRVANWLRDNFDYPGVQLGSVRLLASPTPGELPLPGGATPPPATYAEVKKAVTAWRRQARATPGNITLLFLAGHGIQSSNEGGILLLQDVGDPDAEPLDHALDVASIRLGMVADPNDADTSTPPVQYYFYDACRVQPAAVAGYEMLKAGLTVDVPRGPAADMSWVVWGSRSRDYALADAETRTTLFSQALIDCLESRAPAAEDKRTVRFGSFQSSLEEVVEELARAHDEQQSVVLGGSGQMRTPVYLRKLVQVEMPGQEHQQQQEQQQQQPQVPIVPVPRAVMITMSSGDSLGLTLRSVGGWGAQGVEVEAVSGSGVDLLPGQYVVDVDLPWGGSTRRSLSVPWGITPIEQLIRVPDQPARSVTGSARLDRQLGPVGGANATWYLRFLTWTSRGLRVQSREIPPAVEVDDLEGDTVAIMMHTKDRVFQYAQLRTGDGRSLVVALPITYDTSSHTCWLHVRVSESALGAVVRLNDRAMDVCAGYLTGGRPDHVLTLAPSFEQMLFSKLQDPIGATLGGYALLKLNDLDRIHDWADNLANWFEWLPDGAVIAGEVAARRGDDTRAAEFFETAIKRGISLFSEGLSILANRLPRLTTDADLAPAARRRLRTAARRVLVLSPAAEFGALATTLHVDPDPGEITAKNGWRQFVRASMPDDPRDFWRAP